MPLRQKKEEEARFEDITDAPKESSTAPLELTANVLQAAKAWRGRALVRQRSKSDTRAGTSDVLQAAKAWKGRALDAAPPSQTAAAEPTIVELSTSASITTITPASTSEDHEAAERRCALSWLARQDELSRSDDDLLAHRAVLLEATVHWKGDATFYKPTKVQLLGAEAGDAADAEAGAPPWSILMVHGKAVHYEEVTAVNMDEKILEFVVEHTRKRSSRSERLRRQHLRMRTCAHAGTQ